MTNLSGSLKVDSDDFKLIRITYSHLNVSELLVVGPNNLQFLKLLTLNPNEFQYLKTN